MSQTPNQSSRARAQKPVARKQRTFLGAISGLIGAVVMSVIAAILLTAAVTPMVALTGAAATSAVSIFENLPSHLDPGKQAQPSDIYALDSDGKRSKIATFYVQDRVEVGWDEVSQHVKDAAVAIEDPKFYSHGGVNVLSASRAAIQNVTDTGDSGASTITMQYVRNVLVQEAEAILDAEDHAIAYEEAMGRNIDRKLKEMRLSVSLEKKFTKDEILLGYLNISLFGRQVYGIESASRYFFNKSAKDLTLAESASLVATVNAPTKFQVDIEENLPANKERRDLILGSMLETGKITQEQHDEAVATEVEPDITPKTSGCTAVSNLGMGHFCNYVKTYIENDKTFGNTPAERMHNFSRGGFKIDTTIDLDIQQAAYQSFQDNIPAQYPGFDAGGAAVTTEVGTGRVLAMMQNRPFSENPVALEKNPDLTSINFNTDHEYGGSSGFQVGSTFKPFNLANWLRSGRSLQENINANGRTIQESNIPAKCFDGGVYGWNSFEVSNHLGIQWGTKSVLFSMAQSSNGAFISMLEKTDLCDIVDIAEDMGVHRATEQSNPDLATYGTRELTRVPATTFAGIDEVAPITMAAAYAGFSGGGKVCTPIPIDSIKDSDGAEVEFTKGTCNQAIDPDVAAGVAYALEYNVNSGIGGHARSYHGIPHFAKTGTTDDFWDHWTIGGSTKAVTAMWTGNVVGKVSTEFSGLPYHGDNAFGDIVNAADVKLGGDAFDKPDPAALRQVLKGVPDTRGKSFEEASQMLKTLGFTVRDGGETSSAVQKGLVARTEPEGGSETTEGSDVTIFRSDGTQKAVPDGIVGASSKEATQILQSAGFSKISRSCQGDGDYDDNSKVLSVNPSSGSDAKLNSQITLKLECKVEEEDDDD